MQASPSSTCSALEEEPAWEEVSACPILHRERLHHFRSFRIFVHDPAALTTLPTRTPSRRIDANLLGHDPTIRGEGGTMHSCAMGTAYQGIDDAAVDTDGDSEWMWARKFWWLCHDWHATVIWCLSVVLFPFVGIDEKDMSQTIAELLVCITSLKTLIEKSKIGPK